jgi:hypothetical protein
VKIAGKRIQWMVRPKVASGGDFPSYSLPVLFISPQVDSLACGDGSFVISTDVGGLRCWGLGWQRGNR